MCVGVADRGHVTKEAIGIVVFVWQSSGLHTAGQVPMFLCGFLQGFQYFENNLLWFVQGWGSDTLDKGCLRQEWMDAMGLHFDGFIYISMSVLRHELSLGTAGVCGWHVTERLGIWDLEQWGNCPLSISADWISTEAPDRLPHLYENRNFQDISCRADCRLRGSNPLTCGGHSHSTRGPWVRLSWRRMTGRCKRTQGFGVW